VYTRNIAFSLSGVMGFAAAVVGLPRNYLQVASKTSGVTANCSFSF
jgi:hypothetical protein